jgi:3-phosphoshikimate 1-carboxyvinyltransferase
METITVRNTGRILKGELQLPFSKSISNRLLMIRSLSGQDFSIHNLSDSGDTVLLSRLLEEISARSHTEGMHILDTGNAGTVMRFLTAYLASVPGKWILTGSDRMKERPIGILVDALKPLGAHIEYLSGLGFPPVMIKGTRLKGGEIIIDPGISSQFVSALILVAPAIPGGLTLHLRGPAVSFPYIDMTIRLMGDYGIRIQRDKTRIVIPEAPVVPRGYEVETDWSSAAFWYEAAAFADEVDLVLTGLRNDSLQGDSILARIYSEFGVQTEFLDRGVRLTRGPRETPSFSFNFSDYPDIAPAVITTCAVLCIHGRFEGLKNLKIKESDRLLAMKKELDKLGIVLEADSTGDHIRKIEVTHTQLNVAQQESGFDTYGDHRMAMTFAPLALLLGSVRIHEPDVVDKSYPGYWEDLKKMGFWIE